MHLNKLIEQAFKNNSDKGFWDDQPDEGENNRDYVNTKLLLMVSEIVEAMEALRKDNPPSAKIPPIDSFAEEIADLAIRMFDFCGWAEIDLEYIIQMKMNYNEQRENKHGKLF